MKTSLIVTTIAGILALATAASAGDRQYSRSKSASKAGADIVETAVAAGSFDTLVAAVKAAGLVEALKGDGPFTVFAPTDEAFAQLPKSTLKSLLRPENREQLAAILTYHVVPGDVPSSQAVKLTSGSTLNGQRLSLTVDGGALRVDEAQVVKADIRTSNGVIHVIDRVLMPVTDSVVDLAVNNGFTTLAAAVTAAGLVETLSSEGPFTVLAPTDDAFAALPAGTLDELLKPANRDQLTAILTYHVIPGRIYADQAITAGQADTVNGAEVRFAIADGRVRAAEAAIVGTDLNAANGVVHVIDQVLLPPGLDDTPVMASTPQAEAMTWIEMAIDRGAPLYNQGQPAACAAIYEITARNLLSQGDRILGAAQQSELRRALRKMGQTHDADRQAWILRRALDSAYGALAPRAM